MKTICSSEKTNKTILWTRRPCLAVSAPWDDIWENLGVCLSFCIHNEFTLRGRLQMSSFSKRDIQHNSKKICAMLHSQLSCHFMKNEKTVPHLRPGCSGVFTQVSSAGGKHSLPSLVLSLHCSCI